MFTDHLTYSDQQFLFLSFRLMFNDEGYIVIWDQFIDRIFENFCSKYKIF